MDKPVKEAVVVVIKDAEGRILVVQRAYDDTALPGVWGFPAASRRDGESEQGALHRVGVDKLGVEIRIGSFLGEDTAERARYVTHLKEYEAEIVNGVPAVPQSDISVSQYIAFKYTQDPTVLFDAARKGALCSRIYLRGQGISWE